MSLAPGTRLGPYEITGQIGAGGMGDVYRATDTNLRRQVAIKVLPDAIAQDPERVARFEREARTLATLNHPNIAIVHGFEKGDGVRALVMGSSRDRPSPIASRKDRCLLMKSCPSPRRSPRRWKPRTSRASFIGT